MDTTSVLSIKMHGHGAVSLLVCNPVWRATHERYSHVTISQASDDRFLIELYMAAIQFLKHTFVWQSTEVSTNATVKIAGMVY